MISLLVSVGSDRHLKPYTSVVPQATAVVDAMKDELAEGQRSLLALSAGRGAGGEAAAIETPADPTIELAALLRDRKCVPASLPLDAAPFASCRAPPCGLPCLPALLMSVRRCRGCAT